MYDVVIVGGGPAGLAAALVLGRACKRVLLSDGGPRRNQAAVHVHGFVSRDGITPDGFRQASREQLRAYPDVEIRDTAVEAIAGDVGDLTVRVGDADVRTRRVLLATGMVDVLPDLPGFAELWGRSIFMCPYCHGWEVRGQRFGYLAPSPAWLEFGLFLTGWTRDIVVFTHAAFPVPDDVRVRLADAGVQVDERAIARLDGNVSGLQAIELADGTRVPRDVLFARPTQRQIPLVQQLDLTLDDQGYVRVDEHGRTSRPGVHAAGDLTTAAQSALAAAAAGAKAASMINHALTLDAAPLRAMRA